MRKDIEITQAENIHIVAINEWDEELLVALWNVYFVNNRDQEIDTVLVVARGNTDDKKTTTLRQNLGNVASKTSVKVELISDNVFGFTNEYLVTFFVGNQLFERNFTFAPHSIAEDKTVKLPVLESEGILAT